MKKFIFGSVLVSAFALLLVLIISITVFRNLLPDSIRIILNSKPKNLGDIKDIIKMSIDTHKYDRRKRQ